MQWRRCKPAIKAGVAPLLLMLPLGGSVQANEEVADVMFGVTSVSFYPKVSYAQVLLTVAGNGVYEEQTFSPGDSITFSAQLSDGNYKYQLIAIPDKDEEAWTAAAGNEAEERAQYEQEAAETFYQSGGFEVVMGVIKEPAPGNDDDTN